MNNHTLTNDEVQTIIEEQVINPNINESITSLLKSRNVWKKISNITETLGHTLTVGSTILAFASGVYNIDSLAFVAGCFSIGSLSLLNFSNYASNKSNERNNSLNNMLIRINVQPLPMSINTQLHNSPLHY